MAPDDLLGDRGSTVVLVSEDDDVRTQFGRALEDDVRDVVFGGVDEFTVHCDPRGGELVHRPLHDIPFTCRRIVLAVQDPEPRPGIDVVGDDMAACEVQQVNRSTGHLRELGRPLEGIVG